MTGPQIATRNGIILNRLRCGEKPSYIKRAMRLNSVHMIYRVTRLYRERTKRGKFDYLRNICPHCGKYVG